MESKHRTCPLLIYPRRTVCAFGCVREQVCLCEGESGGGGNLVSMATSSFNPLPPSQPPSHTRMHTRTHIHPSPPDENPGGLCVMRFH